MLSKIFQKAAFRLESGKTGVNQAPGWGAVNANTLLGSGHAFPYLSLGKTKTVNSVEDNSITSLGFKEIPRKISNYAETSISLNNRFDGLNPMLYWMFGLEDEVQSVVCYVCSEVTTVPAAGDTYSDGPNTCTFLRREINKSTTFYIFSQDDVPTGATGTLTRLVGSGDATLTFTARSPLMYEHILMLDSRSRHLIDVPTDEQLTDYDSGDKKCRMALIGINMDTDLDFVYQNAMCKKFSIASNAGEISTISNDFLAYDQTIGDQDSDTWTYPSGLQDSDNLIMHHDWLVQLAEFDSSSLTTVGVTSFNLNVDIPLQVIQDTVSGLYIVEPVLEGKYGTDLDLVLSRYSSTAWQSIMDNWSSVKARLSATSGYCLQEILVNMAKLVSEPDDDNVTKENLKLSAGDYDSNNWAYEMPGATMRHSPIMLRVRNLTSTNSMLS